jgi:hypothetical protein
MRFSLRRILASLLPLAALVYLCSRFRAYSVDDAYITLRYVRNLLEGQGLVYNPGERVEGLSNLLWVVLLAPLGRIGLDLLTAARLLGAASAAATLILVLEMGVVDLGLSYAVAIPVTLWLACSTGFVYYAISGLETTLYALLVVLLVRSLMRNRLGTAGVVCGLLCLARPEGLMFGPLFALRVAWVRPGWRRAIALLAIPAAFIAGLMLWRWSYYGALLPNTFQAKIDLDVGPQKFLLTHLRSFLVYSLLQLRVNAMIWLAALPGFLLLPGRGRVIITGAAALLAFFVWFSGGDWMDYSRFYVPAYPLLALAAGFAFGRAAQAFASSPWSRAVGWAALWLPAALAFATAVEDSRRLGDLHGPNPAMSSIPHAEIGRYLARAGAPGDAVVVNEVGAIGYYSRLRVIDMLGLTDRRVLWRIDPAGLTAYGDYIVAQRPRFILLNDRQEPWDTRMHSFHQAILDAMTRSGGYRYDRSFALNYYKHLLLYVRK